MKWLMGALLVLNIGFFSWFALSKAPEQPQQPLHQPLQPEKIKLLIPEEVEALPKIGEVEGSPKPDEVYGCYEWGSFAEQSLKQAQNILVQNSLIATVEQKTSRETMRYWVYIPPLPSAQAAQDKVVELKALGVDVSFIIQEAPWRNAISLGVFKDERLATKLLEQLKQRGVVSAQKGIRNQEKGRSSLLINNMSSEMAIELNKLGASFPGSELKQVICQ
ncbi:SPOR domain-containing protein [Methylobacillus gramineus]|uniref:SPOR domain-containing protein n=1 Tax=Methylobacillus gramineus TaxID=755169 RepID=UPI001CFF9BAF|nr:SPOR domain-containing protein [Methylobacillus gramineus]MCB5183597.1 SPOR domain-containing protein [Methylobacillus gramineus]